MRSCFYLFILHKKRTFAVKSVRSCNTLMQSYTSTRLLTDNDVTVEYHRGLPRVTVPLPSRKERCRFTLKPITNTVGDFIEMLRKEDKGIDRVVCTTKKDTRIASSSTIETLLEEDFKLVINDKTYNVNTPNQERITGEEVKRLGDVKTLIFELYHTLNIQDHHVQKEVEIATQIETIRQELMPIEQKINELDAIAQRKANWLAWGGLGLMSVQFGILARLTWWEYSWDIMEPVTYFVTYGSAMAMYAYYVVTREEYILEGVRERQQLLELHNKAGRLGVDLNKYNTLQDQVVMLEKRMKKLKHPLKTSLPQKDLGNEARNPLAVPSIDGSFDQLAQCQPKENHVPSNVKK